MTRKLRTILFATLCAAALPAALSALTLKMGTVAPENTPWDTALKEIASDWSSASNGEVTLRLYPGALAGDESDMIRKMRIDELQAAALTGDGLVQIVPDVIVFDLPFLFGSEDEFRYVLDRMTPEFQKKFAEKGFVLLKWDIVGWLKFFSRRSVTSPADLMTQKLAIPSGTKPDIIRSWQEAGFQVTPIAISDLMTALSSGMVDAFFTEPLAAAAYQWFGIANNMSTLKIAPLIGGIVITERAWRQIPDQYKPQFLASVGQAQQTVLTGMSALEQQAMGVMVQNGLTVNDVSPDQKKQWRDIMEGGFEQLDGKAYSADVYNRIMALVAAYHAAHP